MRLINPTPGEAADRQTILQLKISYGGGKAETPVTSDDLLEQGPERSSARTVLKNPSRINIQPFIDENEQIQRYLEKSWFPNLTEDRGQEFDKLYEQLGEVNQQLWKLMDQAHILRDAPDRMQEQANARAAEVLYAIVDLNERRAELVYKVNGLFSVTVQEKLYA